MRLLGLPAAQVERLGAAVADLVAATDPCRDPSRLLSERFDDVGFSGLSPTTTPSAGEPGPGAAGACYGGGSSRVPPPDLR